MDVGRALGSSHEYMELWECCSWREVQATPTGLFFLSPQGVLGPEESFPNLLLSQVDYFWDAQTGCKCLTTQLTDQCPHNLLGRLFHTIWELCCAPSALQREEDKKQSALRHFSNCFLKAWGAAPKGDTLRMHQSRAFWMHQLNEM